MVLALAARKLAAGTIAACSEATKKKELLRDHTGPRWRLTRPPTSLGYHGDEQYMTYQPTPGLHLLTTEDRAAEKAMATLVEGMAVATQRGPLLCRCSARAHYHSRTRSAPRKAERSCSPAPLGCVAGAAGQPARADGGSLDGVRLLLPRAQAAAAAG